MALSARDLIEKYGSQDQPSLGFVTLVLLSQILTLDERQIEAELNIVHQTFNKPLPDAGEGAAWGSIIGSISSQADLQNALDEGIVHSKVVVASGVTSLFTVPLNSNDFFGATFDLSLMVFDGTNLYHDASVAAYATVITNGVDTRGFNQIGEAIANPSALGSSSIVLSETFSAGVLTVKINPNFSGFTPSAGYPLLKYQMKILTGQTPTYL